ncbi:hypothetical protein [Pseudomaricurvus alkylphenolicus]|jgi:hypothetical protein|uniref:hypothetical protein n=1 Tax=Pseudomaricurvus alkylphenolicus TaxID=1306991 RepID=UPI00141F7BE1|nr:hypothetical protein [Pseudomaricurvus alkylphenolicus]
MFGSQNPQEEQKVIKSIGRHGLLLTAREYRCFQLAQEARRTARLRELRQWRRYFWPTAVNRFWYAGNTHIKVVLTALLILISPLYVAIGLLFYLFTLICLPVRMLQTYRVPKTLKAPGEKTLIGLHNAFQPIMDMGDQLYVECMDNWVEELFGNKAAQKQNLSRYMKALAAKRQDIDPVTGQVMEGIRSNLSVAREYLSRDLGHYLQNQKSRRSAAA